MPKCLSIAFCLVPRQTFINLSVGGISPKKNVSRRQHGHKIAVFRLPDKTKGESFAEICYSLLLAKKKIQKGKKLSRLAFFRCVSASDKCGKGRQTDRQVSPSTWVQFTLSEMSAACSEPQVASCIWLDICLSDSRCVEGREATSPCCSYHNNYMAETMGTKCAGGTTSNNDIKQWHSAIVAPTTPHPLAPSPAFLHASVRHCSLQIK